MLLGKKRGIELRIVFIRCCGQFVIIIVLSVGSFFQLTLIYSHPPNRKNRMRSKDTVKIRSEDPVSVKGSKVKGAGWGSVQDLHLW